MRARMNEDDCLGFPSEIKLVDSVGRFRRTLLAEIIESKFNLVRQDTRHDQKQRQLRFTAPRGTLDFEQVAMVQR